MAQLLGDAIFQRVFDVVDAGPRDPYAAIRQDGGLRAILNAVSGSAPATRYVLYAAVVGPDGRSVAHSEPLSEGTPLPRLESFSELVDKASPWTQLRAVHSERRFELDVPILAGTSRLARSGSAYPRCCCAAISSPCQERRVTALIALCCRPSCPLLAQWMLRRST